LRAFMKDLMPTIRTAFHVAAMVCAAIALAKLAGFAGVRGGVIEWAAVAVAAAQAR
jgi:hypothetical protein